MKALFQLSALALAGIAVGHHTGSVLDGFGAVAAIYMLMPWQTVAR